MSKYVLGQQTADALKGLIRGANDGGIEGAGFMPGVFIPGDPTSSTAKIIYVSGPPHSTIENILWSSIRPYDWTTYTFTTVGAINCWAYDVLGTYNESGYYIAVQLGLLEDLGLYVILAPAKAIGRVGDDESGTTYNLSNHPYWLFDYDSGFRFAVEGADPYDNLVTSITPATPTQAGIVSVGSQTFSAGKTFTDNLFVDSPSSAANMLVMGVMGGTLNLYDTTDGHSLHLGNNDTYAEIVAGRPASEAESPYSSYQIEMLFVHNDDEYGYPCLMVNRYRTVETPTPSPTPVYDTVFSLGINGHTGAHHPDAGAMIQVHGGLVTNIDSDLANGIIDGGEWT